jgi:catechol 2,3-dioxygenase-like lactoylglutathione lyase family enzyme
MPFHHVALAVKDAKATHEFYTNAMGFRLAKVEVGEYPGQPGSWMKHLFYDTGSGGMIAFWDLHDPNLPEDWSPAIAGGLGLPAWSNHIAFDAGSVEELETVKSRWLSLGHDVMEVDHGWCSSVYTNDPNGILVEFCATTRALDEDDAREALDLLDAERPDPKSPPVSRFHKAPK